MSVSLSLSLYLCSCYRASRSYLVQAAFASVAIPLQTDRFYDLAGSLGFISTTIVSSFYPNFRLMLNNAKTFGLTSGRIAEGLTSEMWNPVKVLSVRQMVVGGMVIFWAGRLGSFLIQVSGVDSRAVSRPYPRGPGQTSSSTRAPLRFVTLNSVSPRRATIRGSTISRLTLSNSPERGRVKVHGSYALDYPSGCSTRSLRADTLGSGRLWISWGWGSGQEG